MRTKPLLIAVALALGSSAPAFAGSTDGTNKAAENTNSRTAPQVLGSGADRTTPVYAASPDGSNKAADDTNSRTAPQVLGPGSAPIATDSAAPVVPGTTVYRAPADTRVMRSDDVREHALRNDDDASERAARKARATEEEEHGGLRNGMHDKKDRARERAGVGRDDD